MRSTFYRFLTFTLSLLAVAPIAHAQQEIFAPLNSSPPAPYIAPNRLFSLVVPPGWITRTFPDKPDFVEVRMADRPGTAWLQIQRSYVNEGAKPRQMMARAVELRLKKMPHFRELLRRDVEINGIKAASVLGTYWFQGNAQYPRAVEEVYVVLGHDAYELHFECFEPYSQQLAAELDRLYASFVPRPSTQVPVPAEQEDQDEILDKIPF